jgi:hypothetical protein
MSVTCEAVLDVSEESVLFLSGLLHAERVRRGTRKDTRALGPYKQAVMVLRWFFDDTRMTQLARDNRIGKSTAYEYRDHGEFKVRGRPLTCAFAAFRCPRSAMTWIVVPRICAGRCSWSGSATLGSASGGRPETSRCHHERAGHEGFSGL